jgi:outer membrane receptor protein involved in Fe transport
VVASRESAVSNNSSAVFPADDDGNQTSTDPITIVDNTRKIGHLYGAYIQDQWQATEKFTVNYGLRADHVNAFIKEGQLSPRVGAVYQLSDDTTLHAGYARYFTPPPTELIAPTDIALFQNTTNALPTNANTDIRSERSHYFDVGISHQLSPALTVGLDAYYRKVRNLLDEGQFGQALVFSPFNYDRARVYGLEFTSSYATDALSAYLNITTGKAEATKVVTGQFNFEQDELDYIATHYVHVDHDQKLTASAGVSYLWGNTRFGADALFGSGLRRGFANSDHVPAYAVVNLSATHDFDLPGFGKLGTRIAVLNVFDKVYELRDGSGIGVGAPQFGARRGLYVGLTKEF